MGTYSDYPLHPGQTAHAGDDYVQLPMEEFERLKGIERDAKNGSDPSGAIAELENEVSRLVDANAKLRERIAEGRVLLTGADSYVVVDADSVAAAEFRKLSGERFELTLRLKWRPDTVRIELGKEEARKASVALGGANG